MDDPINQAVADDQKIQADLFVKLSQNLGDGQGKTNQSQSSSVAPKQKELAPIGGDRGKGQGQSELNANYAESDKVAKAEGDEYWESYAREIELEKQILEMGGIEKVEAGEVKVPENVAKEMGIEPTVTVHTPMEKATGFSVSGVTFSDDQITSGLVKPTSSGLRWMVEWFIYQLLKAHFHIKRIKGVVTRQKEEQIDDKK